MLLAGSNNRTAIILGKGEESSNVDRQLFIKYNHGTSNQVGNAIFYHAGDASKKTMIKKGGNIGLGIQNAAEEPQYPLSIMMTNKEMSADTTQNQVQNSNPNDYNFNVELIENHSPPSDFDAEYNKILGGMKDLFNDSNSVTTRQGLENDNIFTSSGNSNITINNSQNSIAEGISIFCQGGIYTRGVVISASDSRIKTNIQDISDNFALEGLRLLKPKTYNYIDTDGRGSQKVIGFLAQDVASVFPIASKQVKDFIPNIYEIGIVDISLNTLTLQEKLTTDLSVNDIVKLMDTRKRECNVTVSEIIDTKTFSFSYKEDDEFTLQDMLYDLSYSYTTDSSGNNVLSNINVKYETETANKVFVFGKEVNDFHTIKKEYLHTLCVPAIQELDRQVVTLQTQVADILQRINNLES